MRFVLLILCLLARPALAAQPAELCERAALQVAAESGIPADVLGALTLTETGRRLDGLLRPWAWAVNAEGAGTWFDEPAQALAYAQMRVSAGRPNVDIGCFQINYRWHGEHFPSLEAMFDPLTNSRYAAHFLRQLYAETGDWRAAAGAFHSRRPEDARRYLARFDQLRSIVQTSGFAGMRGGPDSYNQFADATGPPLVLAGLPGPRRERVMLLGAPLGSQAEGQGGSLAVTAAARGPLVAAPRGALIMVGGAATEAAGASLWR